MLSETGIGGDTASFSGRVVDGDGNPVAGLALVIQSREVDDDTGTRTYGSDFGSRERRCRTFLYHKYPSR